MFRWQVIETDGSRGPSNLVEVRDAPGTGFSVTGQGTVNPGREGSSGPFWLGASGYDTADQVVAELVGSLHGTDALGRESVRNHHDGVAQAVMIDVARQQLRDDAFLLALAPVPSLLTDLAGSGYAHATVSFDVADVHAGRWTVWSDPASCSW